MLYQINDGTVSAGGRTILSHIHFEIKGTEKIALVGRNGAGKTTLLRLIAGELELDRDDHRQQPGVACSRKLTVRMLRQTSGEEAERTVEELLLEGCQGAEPFSQERYAYELEYDRLFTGLGFDKTQKDQKLSSFSGGEQTKLLLIRELLSKPDILLLDEPTNHLDLEAVEWLEGYLQSYRGAVVIVSHDRFFLDQVVGAVYELQNGTLTRFAGSYTDYRRERSRANEAHRKAYERQQAEIARLNELIERFKHKPKKAAFARSRKTMLERMEKLPRPVEEDSHSFTDAIEPEHSSSKWVIRAEKLKIGYQEVVAELSLRVRRGQKIGIIGNNGAGKSTFLKTVAGLLEPIEGECELGDRVKLGYFDQQAAGLQSELSVLEHYQRCFPAKTQKEIRQSLGAYLFRGQEASKRVSDLSGGEKARLVLAELLTSRPNLMLLDEPTNHMDIPAKETLESAFMAYNGTLLFISHDRYFIRQVADALLVFEDGEVMYYPFGYEHYLERREKTRRGAGGLSAILRAEELAMVAALRAVPEAERHRLREISTESAYIDWRMRLAAEPLREARERVEALTGQWRAEQERWLIGQWESEQGWWSTGQSKAEQEQWLAGQSQPEQGRRPAGQRRSEQGRRPAGQSQAEQEQRLGGADEPQWCAEPDGRLLALEQELHQAEEEWTAACLTWYDQYLSL